MGYAFYGWNKGDVLAVTDEHGRTWTPCGLYDALSDIWCEYTCAPRLRGQWSEENRTLGQCSVTAFLAQDIFGGEVRGILRPGGNYHCYNVVGDYVFDLTSEQFGGEELNYENNPEQFREIHFAKEEKRQRYEFLKGELERRFGGETMSVPQTEGLRPLYEQKPELTEFDAWVKACRPGKNSLYYVTLDQTAFYPEGGGQPFDTGTLNQARVVEVHERDGEILHYVDRELEAGSRVHGVVDWERRQSHMQHHSGEHIFSGLVHSRFGYDNVGFHMGQDAVTIDFNGTLTVEQVRELEAEANRLVWADVPVEAWYPSAEELAGLDYRSKKEIKGPVRIVRIPGGDTCACCGTHVSRTGQIGVIKVVGLKKYKGGVRLEMVCGARALGDYDGKQEQVIRVSNLLSARQGQISGAVEKLMEESAALKRQAAGLYQQMFRLRCQQLPRGEAPLLMFEEEMPLARLREFVTLLCQEGKGSVVLACSGHDGDYHYVLGSREGRADELAGRLNRLLRGKGSGKGMMTQGMLASSREEIEQVWNEGAWKE